MPRLRKHASASEYATTSAFAFVGRVALYSFDAGANRRQNFGAIAEFRRDRQPKLDEFWHRTSIAKEVPRTARAQWSVREQVDVAVDAWPMMNPVDESVFHSVRGCVDELRDDSFSIEQASDAWLFGRPEVVPPPTQCILTASEHLVKVLDEFWEVSMTIKQIRVVMVRFSDRKNDLHVESLRRFGETVSERVVRLVVGA